MDRTKSHHDGSQMERLTRGFSAETLELITSLSEEALQQKLARMITPPITLNERTDSELLELYYTSSYVHLFETFNIPKKAKLFEIAAGDTIFIPKALNAYADEGAKYITANLNKSLTSGFREKASELSIELEIIEDNGINILSYCGEGKVDVAVFHHAMNDIVQTIIAEREGNDTVNVDWWTAEPQMLQTVMAYHNRGELKTAAYSEFISIIETCMKLLKEDGYFIFDNCTYAGYEDMGYNSDFHSNYIQLAREWIHEADLGLQEVELEGFDPKWWMVLQKT
ncbi:hypothetical protein ACK8P5_15175 [Paenibacillus sp. EC2-1]|uniref:hypothetical protein n=1 Tax=Paenibacillus sp. EC2-1 TaxID=3388665 RepID=UPI003BEEB123